MARRSPAPWPRPLRARWIIIPYIEVVNVSRALDQLAERGFWRIAPGRRRRLQPGRSRFRWGDVALVLGSEGDGIRRLVREHCEASAFHSRSTSSVESLNVSNAAAIALL